VGIVGVDDIKALLFQDPAELPHGVEAQEAIGNCMNDKILGCGMPDKRAIAPGKQLGLVSARAQAAKGEKNLVLASAPIRLGIEMQRFHFRKAR
jgi:hypothetical protein